jgi:starvation-inducible DNA-binding protein
MTTQSSNSAVIGALSTLLATSYTLYLKTQNYHWNVTGPMFTTLHGLFMTQYTELGLAVDEMAERIRALGAFAPGSLAEFEKLSQVKEASGRPTAEKMVATLAADQKILIDCVKAVITAAEKVDDAGTVDMATKRLEVHDKNAWMLSSHLE